MKTCLWLALTVSVLDAILMYMLLAFRQGENRMNHERGKKIMRKRENRQLALVWATVSLEKITTDRLMHEPYSCTSEEDAEKMREALATLSERLLFMRSMANPENYMLAGWKRSQDESVKRVIWELEQMGGDYEGQPDRFEQDWSKGEYSPAGALYFSKDVLTFHGVERQPREEGTL